MYTFVALECIDVLVWVYVIRSKEKTNGNISKYNNTNSDATREYDFVKVWYWYHRIIAEVKLVISEIEIAWQGRTQEIGV